MVLQCYIRSMKYCNDLDGLQDKGIKYHRTGTISRWIMAQCPPSTHTRVGRVLKSSYLSVFKLTVWTGLVLGILIFVLCCCFRYSCMYSIKITVVYILLRRDCPFDRQAGMYTRTKAIAPWSFFQQILDESLASNERKTRRADIRSHWTGSHASR